MFDEFCMFGDMEPQERMKLIENLEIVKIKKGKIIE